MVAVYRTSLVKQAEDELAAQGFESVGTAGCESALATFRSDPKRFDLVLVGDDRIDMSDPEVPLCAPS